jgi:hypothetical protein
MIGIANRKKVTYYFDARKDFWGLSCGVRAKIKAMLDYGRVQDLEIEDVRYIGYDIEEVRISFRDLPDNGNYILKEVEAKNEDEAMEKIKEVIPSAKDIVVWTYKDKNEKSKLFLVSYYVVTNTKEDKENKNGDIALESNMAIPTAYQIRDRAFKIINWFENFFYKKEERVKEYRNI